MSFLINIPPASAATLGPINGQINLTVPKSSEEITYGSVPIVLKSLNVTGFEEEKIIATGATEPYIAKPGKTEIQINYLFPAFEATGTSYQVCVETTCSEAINVGEEGTINATIDLDKSAFDKAVAGDTTKKTSCAIDGVGWIVCPVVNFLAKVADGAFDFLSNSFLETKATTINTSSPVYKAWQIMRNLANVAFVIAFLIIIFSQLTSVGLTNYGVKKLLPRLVIAAILVNISYFVCQIAVDISNILGYSLKSMLISLIPASPDGSVQSGWTTGQGGGFGLIAAQVLTGAGLTIIVLYTLLATLIPIILAAVVALIMILFILVARQAIIILLIVISPLAFVAFLLPNTEQLFKKWQKTFTTMLLLFPIIAVVFGASSLAASVLSSTFTSPNSNSTLGQIAAAAAMVLPLFLVPSLLKKSLDGVGNIGATLNGWGSKMGGALGAKGSKAYDNSRLAQYKNYRSSEANKRRALIQSGQYEGSGGLLWNRKLGNYINRGINARTGNFGSKSAASGVALSKKMEEEEVANAETLMRAQNDATVLPDKAKEIFDNAVKSGDTVKARAAQKILLGSGAPGIAMLRKSVKDIKGNNKNQGTINSLRNDINAANLKGKDAVLAAWGYKNYDPSTVEGDTPEANAKRAAIKAQKTASNEELGYDGISIDTIGTDKSTFSGLNPVELAGQDISVLRTASAAGNITADQARGVLSNQNSSQLLSDDKRSHFEDIIRAESQTVHGGGAGI